MADENKKPASVGGRGRKKDDRNIEMFKLWLNGMPMTKLAQQFNMSRENLYRISQQEKWHEKKQKVIDELYGRSLNEFKLLVHNVTQALKDDISARVQKQRKKKNRILTIEEQKHFLSILEKLVKETRLEAGKPTEVTTGEVVHRIILPEGVKRFGVMPPNPNVKIESETPKHKKDIEIEAKQIKEIVDDSE